MSWKTPPAYEEKVGGTEGIEFDDLDFAEGRGQIIRVTVGAGPVGSIKAWYRNDESPGAHGELSDPEHFDISPGFYLGAIKCRYTKSNKKISIFDLKFELTNGSGNWVGLPWYSGYEPPDFCQTTLGMDDQEIIAFHGTTTTRFRLQSLGVWLLPKRDVDDE